MLIKVLQVAHIIAEFALSLWVFAGHSIVAYLLTLADLDSAALTYDFHKEAIIQLVGAQDKLFVSELVLAP